MPARLAAETVSDPYRHVEASDKRMIRASSFSLGIPFTSAYKRSTSTGWSTYVETRSIKVMAK